MLARGHPSDESNERNRAGKKVKVQGKGTRKTSQRAKGGSYRLKSGGLNEAHRRNTGGWIGQCLPTPGAVEPGNCRADVQLQPGPEGPPWDSDSAMVPT